MYTRTQSHENTGVMKVLLYLEYVIVGDPFSLNYSRFLSSLVVVFFICLFVCFLYCLSFCLIFSLFLFCFVFLFFWAKQKKLPVLDITAFFFCIPTHAKKETRYIFFFNSTVSLTYFHTFIKKSLLTYIYSLSQFPVPCI